MRAVTERPRLVRVSYLDHVEFKDCGDPAHVIPVRCETLGFLEEETPDYIRLLWLVEDVETATFQGMVIVRSCILEMEDLTPEAGEEVKHAS